MGEVERSARPAKLHAHPPDPKRRGPATPASVNGADISNQGRCSSNTAAAAATQLVDAEMLHGVAQIGAFLGMSRNAAEHCIRKGRIPTFTVGNIRCASKAALRAWMAGGAK